MELNKYETVILVNGNLTEDAANKIANKYKEILQDWSGIFTIKTNAIGKKKLAYDIKDHSEAWYYIIDFYSEAKNIAELDRLYRIDENILKFITLKCDDNKIPEEIPETKVNKDDPKFHPIRLRQNHYDYLFGYTDELKA